MEAVGGDVEGEAVGDQGRARTERAPLSSTLEPHSPHNK